MGIRDFLQSHHRECDGIFVDVESAVTRGDWATAERGQTRFDATLRLHFRMEEEVLFPAFEQATGMTGGPTAVMRMEHEQLRALLDALAQAVGDKDKKRFLGLSETLMVMTQQHNMKEEQVLYPMADQHLGAEIVERMRALEA